MKSGINSTRGPLLPTPPCASAHRTSTRCHATSSPPSPSPTTVASDTLLMRAVETLFTFPPIFALAAKGARKKIVDRGKSMGLDFAAEIESLKQVDWEAEVAAVTDPTVEARARERVPYYFSPFHAYTQGNLSIEAALEVTVAAKSVHATVMDPSGRTIDPEGDNKLRSSYSRCMLQLLEVMGGRKKEVRDILDLGAATGLSSLALLDAFPGASVTALDLSPYFLAVGKHLQREREAAIGGGGAKKEQLTFIHGIAEETGLLDESIDLVSMCLVCHELPESASREIFREAYRVLRPGGALCIMEMNPASEAFQRILSNPVPYVIFKSTEPYLLSYIGMNMAEAMKAIGFGAVRQLENSPRHRTVVAIK